MCQKRDAAGGSPRTSVLLRRGSRPRAGLPGQTKLATQEPGPIQRAAQCSHAGCRMEGRTIPRARPMGRDTCGRTSIKSRPVTA